MSVKTLRERGIGYDLMSKYRSELFGIAIISIMLFHYFEISYDKGVIAKLAYAYLVVIDRVGVPIFLILSGMGLFFSMMKDESPAKFYLRRCSRLLVPYFIVAVPSFAVMDFLIHKNTVGTFFMDLFFLNGNHQFWFIALIFVMYLIFPLLFKVFKSGKHNFIKMVILIALSVGINLLTEKFLPDIYAKAEIGLTRVPAFIIGVYFGYKVYHKEKIRWQFWAASVLCVAFCVVARLYLPDNFVRYGENFYAVPLAILIPLLLEIISWSSLNKFFGFFGSMSLELYMVHTALRTMMRDVGMAVWNPLYYLVMLIIAVALSFGIQKLDSFITNKMAKKSNKVEKIEKI